VNRVRLLVVGCAALVATAGWLSWRWSRESGPAPLVANGTDAGVAVATGDVLAGFAVAAEASASADTRAAVDLPATSVRGRVYARTGQPFAGWTVWLKPDDGSDESVQALWVGREPNAGRQADRTATDADGGFAFVERKPGRWRLVLEGGEVSERFELAPGERRTVDLVVDGVVATGHVFRHGAPWPHARIEVRGDGVQRQPHCEKGTFRCIVPPGTYDVEIANPHWPQAPTIVHRVEAPTALAVAWQLDAGGTDLVVDARDADGVALDEFWVRLDGTLDGGERVVREFVSLRGTATFEQVPPGQWQLGVRSPSFRTPASRPWQSSNALPRDRQQFLVSPSTTVRLRLQRAGGEPMLVAPERCRGSPAMGSGCVVWRWSPPTPVACRG